MNNREKTATTLVHSVNAHTRIRLDEMDKPGTYIISFWNDKPLANGLHTVAVSYNGSLGQFHSHKKILHLQSFPSLMLLL